MPTRRADWEARLLELAAARFGQSFVWGVRDCAILGLEAFDALTGGDLASEYIGRYAGALGAVRFQRRFGVDLERVLRAQGCGVYAPRFAQRGDILVGRRWGFACGHVVYGERALSADPKAGITWCRAIDLMDWPGALALRVPA